jgi:hypothetical protein
MEKNQKIVAQLLADLESTKDQTVLDAIVTARAKGDKTVIPAIVKLLGHANGEVSESAKSMLYDVKDQDSIDVILNCYETSTEKPIRNILLQSLWQSNIQPVNHVSKIVKIGLNGTLEDCIEVFSIVTNMIDVKIPDAEAMESIFQINSGIEKIKDKAQKQLLLDVVTFLNEHMDE